MAVVCAVASLQVLVDAQQNLRSTRCNNVSVFSTVSVGGMWQGQNVRGCAMQACTPLSLVLKLR